MRDGATVTARLGRSDNGLVEFSRELRQDVISGRITVSFRLWRRPKVRAGGRYAINDACIEVDAIEHMPFGGITAADVRRAGERDRESLRRRAAHAGPIADDTLVYRVEFHVV
jgi:hypothetical protein